MATWTARKGSSDITTITKTAEGVRFWSVLRSRWETGRPSNADLATMSQAQRDEVANLLG